MKPRDIFNLAVRILGLAFLYHGLTAVGPVFAVLQQPGTAQFITSIILVAWPLVVAYWLLRGAPLLMHIAYPDADIHSHTDNQPFGATEKNATP